MVSRLADKCLDECHGKMAELLEADVLDDDAMVDRLAMIGFLQRMLLHWFMRPFLSKVGGAIEQ